MNGGRYLPAALITDKEAISAQIFKYIKGEGDKTTFFNLKPRHNDKPWESSICMYTAIYTTLS